MMFLCEHATEESIVALIQKAHNPASEMNPAGPSWIIFLFSHQALLM